MVPPPLQPVDTGLRLVALFKFAKATILVAVGLATLQLLHPTFAARLHNWRLALSTSPGHRLLEQALAGVAGLPPGRLEILATGAFLYAALFLTEGAGLWLGRRWAEYLTLVATASLVPIEIFELAHRFGLARLGALALNLAVVGYLWYRVGRSRSTRTKPALALLSALLVPMPAYPPVQAPAQVILIRHADQPADPRNPHLSQAGVERAEQLVSFITTDPMMTRFGLPVAVFATRITKHGNGLRTQETVAPLARVLGLPVQAPFLSEEFAALAKSVLGNPAYAGKTVLVCWNHKEIPQLAAALGVRPKPPKWKSGVFDLVYVISYHEGRVTLATSHYGSR
jgi:uncharacterized membrane protein (DUF2068 family)